jgi:hypothetical protein
MNKAYKRIFMIFTSALFLSLNMGQAQELNLLDNVVYRLYSPSENYKGNSIFLPVSLYDLNNNPAMLLNSDKKSNMCIGYLNESNKNDFRRPFEEEKKSTNIGFADITYMIDTLQAIHSVIKFNNEYSTNRHNIFNLFPYRGDPYLLGDANTGNLDLQMLTIETDYAREVYSGLTLGAEFSYKVGNSVRKYFPKPTADYLEIGSRLSLGYKIGDKLIAGIFGDYFKTYEEIQYEVSYTSPTIFKFRGDDYPFLLLGTSSLTRKNEDFGTGGGFELKYLANENLTFYLTGKGITDEEKVTDGVTVNPQLQGKWKENTGTGNFIAVYNTENYELRAGAVIEINRQFASRPTLAESILKRRDNSFSGFAGINYKINSNLSIFCLYQLIDENLELNDYVNYIRYQVPSITHVISAGIGYNFSEYFGANINYQAAIYRPTIDDIYTRAAAQYFYSYFMPEIKYYQTNYFSNSILASAVYHYGILGDIGLNAKINLLKSDGQGSRNSSVINAYINLFIF